MVVGRGLRRRSGGGDSGEELPYEVVDLETGKPYEWAVIRYFDKLQVLGRSGGRRLYWFFYLFRKLLYSHRLYNGIAFCPIEAVLSVDRRKGPAPEPQNKH